MSVIIQGFTNQARVDSVLRRSLKFYTADSAAEILAEVAEQVEEGRGLSVSFAPSETKNHQPLVLDFAVSDFVYAETEEA